MVRIQSKQNIKNLIDGVYITMEEVRKSLKNLKLRRS